MKVLNRARHEGVELHPTYPELPLIGDTGRWVVRFLLGRPLDNVRWSNATFWRDATSGEPSRWLRLAGWKRAVLRLYLIYTVPLTFLLISLTMLGHWQTALLTLTAHLLLWAAVLSPFLIVRRVRDHGLRIWIPAREVSEDAGELEEGEVIEGEVSEEESEDSSLLRAHWTWQKVELATGRKEWEREKVRPLARTVASLVNRPYHPDEAREWVSVPRDYREQGGAPVEILLPGNFSTVSEVARRRLAHAAAERLGMRDPSATWQLEGEHPRLLLTAPVLPPSLVSMTEVRYALEAGEEYTFLLGMAGSEAFSVGLQEDSPHLALSAGSGAGKSELIKVLVMQALHWGWFVIIMDWKEESQEWAEGLRGVKYVRDIGALHDTCVSLGEEIEYRKANRGQARTKTLVVSEEWGITAPLLAEYWETLRGMAESEERRMMPRRSPAASALMKLNFCGRSLGLHQLLVAQRFSARVTNGNADLRESFSVILMSRWKAQTQKMLAPDIKPFPKKITTPGRWVAVTGDQAVVFQAPLITDEQAREWAESGEPNPLSPWSTCGGPAVTQPAASEVLNSSTLGVVLRADATGCVEIPGCVMPEMKAIEGEVVTPVDARTLADCVKGLNSEYRITIDILRNATRGIGHPDFPARLDPDEHGGSPNLGYLYDFKAVEIWARKRYAALKAEREVRRG
jgi:hypothetical protein